MGLIFSHKPHPMSMHSRDLCRTEVPSDDPRTVMIYSQELKRNGHEICCYVPDEDMDQSSYGQEVVPLPGGGTAKSKSARMRQHPSR